jgi:hypothetical protein
VARTWSAITRRRRVRQVRRLRLARGGLDQRLEDVDLVVAVHVLQDRGQALQAHAGVHAGRGQRTHEPSGCMSNCMNTLFQISM